MEDRKNIQESEEFAILDMIVKGQMITQAISGATHLKVADYLKDGPKSIDKLAEETSSHPNSLYRVLRMLSSVGIFEEVREEGEGNDRSKSQFKLTPMASLLQSDGKNLIKNLSLLLEIESFKRAMNDLLYTIKTGDNAFKHTNGSNLFEYLQQNQKESEIFNTAMTSLTSSQISLISAMYDFSQFETIVDIGGGQGLLLSTILKDNSNLHGILFDLPYAIDSAKKRIQHTDSATAVDMDNSFSSRLKLIEGDFFKSIPSGADGYILKNVLLNWDDNSAVTILKNCLEAMKSTMKSNQENDKQKLKSKLLIIDVIMPEGNEAFIGKSLDILMLVLTNGGRIRTEKEFSNLLNSCGFNIANITRPSDPMNFLSIIEAIPSDI